MNQVRLTATVTYDDRGEVSIVVGVCRRQKPTDEWETSQFATITGQAAKQFASSLNLLRVDIAVAEKQNTSDFEQLLEEELNKIEGDDDPEGVPFQ